MSRNDEMMKTESGTVSVPDCDLCCTYEGIQHRFYSHVKRLMDIVLSALGLAVLLLPLLIVMIVIYMDNPGPIFFSQYRVGLGGRHFKMYKFRSMKVDVPHELSTAEVKDPKAYITRVGKFRRYSIDELPQLFNVLIGDMSLVGPRPLILKEQDMHDMRNHYGVYSVRPGLTGLAQINGRDLVTTEQKVYWDVKYLEGYGFLSDLKIVLGTIPKILRHADVVEGAGKSEGNRISVTDERK